MTWIYSARDSLMFVGLILLPLNLQSERTSSTVRLQIVRFYLTKINYLLYFKRLASCRINICLTFWISKPFVKTVIGATATLLFTGYKDFNGTITPILDTGVHNVSLANNRGAEHWATNEVFQRSSRAFGGLFTSKPSQWRLQLNSKQRLAAVG